MVKISERRKDLRPREKIKSRGVASLNDHELLMAIIGSGNALSDVTKISRDVVNLLQAKSSSIGEGYLNYKDLVNIKGLGPVKSTQLIAGYEFWRRKFQTTDRPVIDSPKKAADQFNDIKCKKQEYFVCITLDGANRLISKRIISIGTLTASLVHPREVFADAITDRAASIIVAHNHPSGNLQPSQADSDVTERLKEVGGLLGINIIDHLIITESAYKSII